MLVRPLLTILINLLRTLALVVGMLCAQSGSADERPLVIASEGARPPFNFLDSNNELAGFEIDLGREICARLHRPCSFVTQDWDSLLPGLLSGQYDAVMAALDITDERRAQIAFSTPYIRMPAAFVVQKSTDLKNASKESLAGKTVGVEEGSASQALLDDAYKDVVAKPFATLEDAMLDLAEGKLSAVLADKLTAADFLKMRREGQQCCRFLADAPRDPAIFGEGIGVGLRKSDVASREAVDAALQAMIDDGTFAKISAKYFDFPVR